MCCRWHGAKSRRTKVTMTLQKSKCKAATSNNTDRAVAAGRPKKRAVAMTYDIVKSPIDKSSKKPMKKK